MFLNEFMLKCPITRRLIFLILMSFKISDVSGEVELSILSLREDISEEVQFSTTMASLSSRLSSLHDEVDCK